MLTYLFLGVFIASISSVEGSSGQFRDTVHWVTPGNTLNIEENLSLNIFCRKADSKVLINYFRSATLRIISTADDIKLIKGYSDIDVYNQYAHSTKWFLWATNLLPWRVRETSFPTFNTSCVGISTSKPYLALLVTRPIDGWNLCTLFAGIGLFVLAPKLSQSTLFFYGSGTCIGALAAALVLLFVVTRLLTKVRGYYVTITALWTPCLYFTREIWKIIELLLHEKLSYLLVYLTSGALLAFIACYRFGPPQNPKTLDLIRWALQIVGLSLIHLSSDLMEVSTTIIGLTLLYYNFSPRNFYQLQKHWERKFTPKAKLLTEEVYIAQGAIETNKELENIRQFCSTPDCNSWKPVSRLNDPRRLSGSLERSSHLSDEEMMEYESDLMSFNEDADTEELLTDDDSDSNKQSQTNNSRKPALNNGCLTDDEDD